MVPLLQTHSMRLALQTLEFLTSGLGHLFILQTSREAKPPVRGHKAQICGKAGVNSHEGGMPASAGGIHLSEAPKLQVKPEEPTMSPTVSQEHLFCCIQSDPHDNFGCQVVASSSTAR